jgi:hypothetical protein
MAAPRLALGLSDYKTQARSVFGLQHGRIQLRRRLEAASAKASVSKYMTGGIGIVLIKGLWITALSWEH